MISLCPIEALDAAEALLHGELGGEQERAAREHLAACASCRTYYASLAEERDALLSLGESHLELDAPLPAFEAIAHRAESTSAWTPAAPPPTVGRQRFARLVRACDARRSAAFAFALAAAVPALLTARVALVGAERAGDARIVALNDEGALSNGDFTPSEPLCRGVVADSQRPTADDHVCSGDRPATQRTVHTTRAAWGESAVCASSGSGAHASTFASFASGRVERERANDARGLCASED